ncbi:MAG: hypothetical protein WD971_10760, partial [Pirellulales bacterium]
FVGAFAVLVLGPNEANAQGTAVTNQTRQTLGFYGGRSAINTLSEMPRRSAIQPASTGQLQHNGKPFQTAASGPTISPYLNLFRDERGSAEAVPSYYTFVRPQLEQQAAFQQQQRESQQLKRQGQAGPQYRQAVMPGAGTQARYMDTAQFYGGWQR